jgi:hypothetical protein
MESFYGGKRGASFVIGASYDSVEKMVASFDLSSCPVKYGEYALISTANKGDSENGQLYRRGYNINNNLNGAEYVGTIVGPAGPGTVLHMTTIEDARMKYQAMSTGGTVGSSSEGAYNMSVGMVPGKDGTTWNDNIKWYSCSFQTATDGDAQAYLGFEFPYMVVDWTAEIVEEVPTTNNIVTRIDDCTHPYYQKWKMRIPRGSQGNGFNNLRIITADNNLNSYDGKEDDVKNQRKIFAYDYYNGETETTTPIYLGDYNMIEDVSLDDAGTLTIKYTHDDATVLSNKIKWIKTVSLNSETGKFDLTYNTGDTFSSTLKWVKGMTIKDDGTVSLTYTDDTTSDLAKKLNYVSGLEVAADGTITANYTNGNSSTLEGSVKWIKNIDLAENGQLTVSYNNGDEDYTTKLKWPTSIDIDASGTIVIRYNDGTFTQHENYLKTIQKLSLDNETQKLKATYNTNEEELVGEALNSIQKVTVRDTDFHLLVLYTDPDKKTKIEYDGVTGWNDLGSIRDYSGILIGPKLEASADPESLADVETTLNYLNGDSSPYQEGFSNIEDKGKVLVVNDIDGVKQFYAYDYGNEAGASQGWYHLGAFGQSSSEESSSSGTSMIVTGNESYAQSLPTGGIWFVEESN